MERGENRGSPRQRTLGIIPFPEFDDAPPGSGARPGSSIDDAGERGIGWARVDRLAAEVRFQISYFPTSWPVLKT